MKAYEITDYDYSLPTEQIAFHPTAQRDGARLLVWNKGNITHNTYRHIADQLPPNASLVFNNTKVIAARMFFEKNTGGRVEILLLEPADGSYAALHHQKESRWKCLVGGLKKWKQDETVATVFTRKDTVVKVEAKWIEKTEQAVTILFSWKQEACTFAEIVDAAGKVPLPPYIKREASIHDKERYQTVYATEQGSVAAPTAGLHFTPTIFESLAAKNISCSFVTLHVGAGTFKPVSTQNIAEHVMHEEYFEVDRKTISALMDEERNIVPVGTTSMRTIESLFWISIKLEQKKIGEEGKISLDQWEHLVLSKQQLPLRRAAMKTILHYMDKKEMELLCGHTSICITPGYRFKMASALVTNFHQPKSTLLFLIAAIMGEDWKRIYARALEEGYRFLSYGDGCLLFINESTP